MSQSIFNIFDHYQKIIPHKKATLTNHRSYIDFRTQQPSSGFLITLPTQPGITYIFNVSGELQSGSRVFIHLETKFGGERIVDRTTSFDKYNTQYEFHIQFQAKSSLIECGLLSWSNDPTTHLKITNCTLHSIENDPITPNNNETTTEENEENEDNISENEDNISENEDNINENEDNINEHEDNISANEDNMGENEDILSDLEVGSPIRSDYDTESDHNLGGSDLPELLPSQFIIPPDLYEDTHQIDESLTNFEEIENIENIENKVKYENENNKNKVKKLKNEKNIKVEKNINMNKVEKNINKVAENKEKVVDFVDEYDLYDSGRQIDLDEDIKLVDLGFDKMVI